MYLHSFKVATKTLTSETCLFCSTEIVPASIRLELSSLLKTLPHLRLGYRLAHVLDISPNATPRHHVSYAFNSPIASFPAAVEATP